ncbi:Dyp-type peroxidase [Lentzea sp. NBC_00516]|uniref:Dyp-type peroxidase n=1 Tax=Lentzea sp. NBC_00516 TaxID=2903582 RepID=UPI002E8191C0|nr:Dyp-type peroxidase [Lentzea sp. NBC_00516]WUD28624.1 Dyp-type peroxidase [Lentzea sp. NBC_00516]
MSPISRRRLIAGTAAIGLLGGCGSPQRQPGIATPQQLHADISVWDAVTLPSAHVSSSVTVTYGHGIEGLPEFPGDAVRPEDLGGGLFLQICGDDPDAVRDAASRLRPDGRLRWREKGSCNSGRTNVLGFKDGIVVPKTPREFAQEVWRPDGSTFAVVRRMKLDVAAFTAMPVADQERVFGRRKHDAVPLSGGDEVDLSAKTPDGEYVIPADAHVRRAHPLTAGAGLMLRRSYNYDEGLIFISYQRELKTFVNTMHRMADGDALLRYATTTSSAAFRIPTLN